MNYAQIAWAKGKPVFAVLLAVTAIWLIVVLALWIAQDLFVFPGSVTGTPLEGTAAFPKRSMQTRDGLKLGFLVSEPKPGWPVLIYFHGNGGMASQVITRITPFARKGYGVVLAEYRGYADNPGRPSQATFYADGQDYVAWAAAQWPDSQIVLWGESMGIAVTVSIAANQVFPMILDSPFTSVRAVAQQRFPLIPVWAFLHSPFESLAMMDRVKGPVFVVQGEADQIVPISNGRVMAAAAPCLAGSLFIPGRLHLALMWDTDGQVQKAVLDFLNHIEQTPNICRP